MKNVLVRRFVPLVIAIGAVQFAGPNGAGPLMVIGGVFLILFAFVVLPGWWLKFQPIPVTIVQLPDAALRRPLEFEIAESRRQGVLFEYRSNGVVMQGSLDRRWPAFFRPFAGSKEALEEAEKALIEKRSTTAYLEEGKPSNVYLVIKTDWAIVYLSAFLGFVAILIGIGFSL